MAASPASSAIRTQAVAAATEHLASLETVDAVLLVGSTTRRRDANDVDICALVSSAYAGVGVVRDWSELAAREPCFHWLPYYAEELRTERLETVRRYCLINLRHVPLMARRAEPFHAFHRLYLAFQEFLQALFLARRTYPVAYDKWIEEQVEAFLDLRGLYAELPSLVGIENLDLAEIAARAERLEELLETWTTPA